MTLFAARARLSNEITTAGLRDGLAVPGRGARWERSLLDKEARGVISIYEAPERAHVTALRCAQLDYDDVAEVDETVPDALMEGLDNEPGPNAPLFAIHRQFREWFTQIELEAMGFRSATCIGAFSGMSWERSYIEREPHPETPDERWRPRTICLYRAVATDQIRDHAFAVSLPCDEIWEVEELLPQPASINALPAS